MEFRDILQEILQEKNLTQVAFARIVGIKQSQVSEWLKGKAKPGYDMIKQMSISLGVPSDYLLGLFDEDIYW